MGAKILLSDDTIGFMPSREAPFVMRDAQDRVMRADREVCCLLPGQRRRCSDFAISMKFASTICPLQCCVKNSVLPMLLQGPCLPKGLVRTFKIINPLEGSRKSHSGPLLSARHCDLDAVWMRAAQLCDVSMQV
jgi:hypothetical protein